MKNLLLLMIVAIFVLSGCASILGSTDEIVKIQTNVPDVKLTIFNKDMQPIWRANSPASVSLEKYYGFFQGEKYAVRAEKEGFEEQYGFIQTTISAWYFGNIIFGGLIGFLFVDPATGAMWTFSRNNVFINMEKEIEE